MGLLLALALTLLLPGTVQGEGERPFVVSAFRLQASNGYELFALTAAPPAGGAVDGGITLYLRRDRKALVIYRAPAKVSPFAATPPSPSSGRGT